ncbi:polysaccharide biosynthesis protein [Phreatobacter aquaticus]|uniref:Polysaccharide biosynthesis protein n=1 Tax=Phreatobacter aquaticus TaxID=2570229 RepID=A0A4D7QKL1_9HYPH|nr:polysaccharide biosynthesis protein [Phreatobacter aquaticus]QCK88148.1 polysaccharide biosynthesis protein [Phreatobacter aquaticus]
MNPVLHTIAGMIGRLVANPAKKFWVAAHDYCVTLGALFAAIALRGEPPLPTYTGIGPLAPALIFAATAILVYKACDLYASRWRFASLYDLFGIFKAVSVLTLILLAADYLVAPRLSEAGKLFGGRTLIIYWCVQMILLGGPRVAYRAYRSWRRSVIRNIDPLAAIVIGRASDAESVIRMAEAGLAGPLRIYGILSPTANEIGQAVRGVSVWGSLDHVEAVVQDANERGIVVQRAIIAPDALNEGPVIEDLVGRFRRIGIPAIRLDVAYSTDMTRPAQLHAVIDEDLLIRPLVDVDEAPLRDFVAGKRVIVTGGGGSIGSELVLRSATLGASEVLVIDHSEAALHAILASAELRFQPGTNAVTGRICDVRDRARLGRLMAEFKPDVVFHAAALKHVPHLEREVADAARTNVIGTVNAADAAIAARAAVFVLISTDKATKPASILGGTKRIAELYVQSIDAAPQLVDAEARVTRLVSVRFGNVLGTAGSVVPRFRAQIEAGGPVTVTDPAMVRYFMTKKEATDLLWTAARITEVREPGAHSAVLVLNMGQPVRIDDLARRMIRLAGFDPDKSMKLIYIGKRPGERLAEQLFDEREPQFDLGIRGIVAAESQTVPFPGMQAFIAGLAAAAEEGDDSKVRALIGELVPELRPQSQASVVRLGQARGDVAG